MVCLVVLSDFAVEVFFASTSASTSVRIGVNRSDVAIRCVEQGYD